VIAWVSSPSRFSLARIAPFGQPAIRHRDRRGTAPPPPWPTAAPAPSPSVRPPRCGSPSGAHRGGPGSPGAWPAPRPGRTRAVPDRRDSAPRIPRPGSRSSWRPEPPPAGDPAGESIEVVDRPDAQPLGDPAELLQGLAPDEVVALDVSNRDARHVPLEHQRNIHAHGLFPRIRSRATSGAASRDRGPRRRTGRPRPGRSGRRPAPGPGLGHRAGGRDGLHPLDPHVALPPHRRTRFRLDLRLTSRWAGSP